MDFVNGFFELMNTWADALLSFLPDSPFSQYIGVLGGLPYLGYINWIIPVGAFIKIGTAWLIAIGTYYIYSAIMRWVGAID